MKEKVPAMMRSLAGGYPGLFSTCVLCFLQSTPGSSFGAEGTAPSPMAANAVPVQVAPFAGLGDPRSANWTVIPSTIGDGSYSFTVEFKGFSAAAVPEGYVLHIPGEATSAAPGTPAIPRIAKLLPGIRGRTAILHVAGFAPVEVTNITIAAAEAYAVDNPETATRSLRPVRRWAQEIYARDQFWPPELGQAQEAWIGTQKVVRIEVFPVQYNRHRETVRFYSRLEGVVAFEPAGATASP